MAKKRAYQRTDRINQQLLEIISRQLLTEVRDPRVQGVQVTAVEASPDLRHAKVYYVLLDDERVDHEDVAEGLERASGFLRRQLGEQTSMKHIPQLVFHFDESIERGRRMEALFDSLHEDEEQE
jgi:ribosome-binding factor A